jgi:beta-phosphoglucomutase-like phosphatase (HAD superfamily)
MKIEIHPETRGLIFDLDGTLADTMWMHIDAWEKAGRQFGVAISGDLINELAGTPTQPLMQILNDRFGWTIDPEEFEIIKDREYLLTKNAAGRIKPVQYILDIALAHRDIMPMSVGTGSVREDAHMAMIDLNIMDLFKGLITADDITYPKPHPETFLKCAEIIDIDPIYCQVFEDGPMGIKAALAAGMRVTNVLNGTLIEP